MGRVAGEKYLGCRFAVVARSTETYTCTGRPLVAGLRWLRGVQRLIPALGDHWLQGCGGCEEYRDLYLHWETIGCRVAVVARSTETYTCTGRPLVAGLRWLRGVQRLIPALGDHWLQGCDCWEEYRDLYLQWEIIGCRVAVVARSTKTYACNRRPLVAGLRWLRRVQRQIRDGESEGSSATSSPAPQTKLQWSGHNRLATKRATTQT